MNTQVETPSENSIWTDDVAVYSNWLDNYNLRNFTTMFHSNDFDSVYRPYSTDQIVSSVTLPTNTLLLLTNKVNKKNLIVEQQFRNIVDNVYSQFDAAITNYCLENCHHEHQANFLSVCEQDYYGQGYRLIDFYHYKKLTIGHRACLSTASNTLDWETYPAVNGFVLENNSWITKTVSKEEFENSWVAVPVVKTFYQIQWPSRKIIQTKILCLEFHNTLSELLSNSNIKKLHKILINSKYFFDSTFIEKETERIGLKTYWDSPLLEEPNILEEIIVPIDEDAFSPKALATISKTKLASETPLGRKLKKASSKIKKKTDDLNDLIVQIRQDSEFIESKKRRIENLSSQIKELEANIETLTVSKTEVNQELMTLSEREAEFRAQFTTFCSTFEVPAGQFESLKRAGICIEKLFFNNAGVVNPSSMKEIGADDKLINMVFSTAAPIIIYVDGYQGLSDYQIVGGPYRFSVSCSGDNVSLTLCLKKPNAIFGKNERWFRFHPHSESKSLEDFADIWNEMTYACLGSAASGIAKGFADNNLIMIVQAVMAWATSCYTDDAWGETYTMFLTPEQVHWKQQTYKTDSATPELVIQSISDLINTITI